MRLRMLAALLMSFTSIATRGQVFQNPSTPATQTGTAPYSTSERAPENVSIGTGDVSVYLPVLTDVGKGGQTYVFAITYDNHSAYSLQASVQKNQNLDVQVSWAQHGALPTIAIPTLTADISPVANVDVSCTNSLYNSTVEVYATTNFVFTDETGVSHSFPNQRDFTAQSNGIQGCGQSGVFFASNQQDSLDGSFMRLDTTNPNDVVVYTKSGTQYHFTGLPTTYAGQAVFGSLSDFYIARVSRIVDIHGNTITWTSAANGSFYMVDSVGRTFTITPQGGLLYVGSGGESEEIAPMISDDTFSGQSRTETVPQRVRRDLVNL